LTSGDSSSHFRQSNGSHDTFGGQIWSLLKALESSTSPIAKEEKEENGQTFHLFYPFDASRSKGGKCILLCYLISQPSGQGPELEPGQLGQPDELAELLDVLPPELSVVKSAMIDEHDLNWFRK